MAQLASHQAEGSVLCSPLPLCKTLQAGVARAVPAAGSSYTESVEMGCAISEICLGTASSLSHPCLRAGVPQAGLSHDGRLVPCPPWEQSPPACCSEPCRSPPRCDALHMKSQQREPNGRGLRLWSSREGRGQPVVWPFIGSACLVVLCEQQRWKPTCWNSNSSIPSISPVPGSTQGLPGGEFVGSGV